MTISTTTSRISYNGNGVTTVFAVPFRFFQNSDLVVQLVTVSTGATSTLTLTTHYTVTGADEEAGGSLTMLTAPAVGQTLVIRRVIAATQEVDYISGEPFPAETHERALDRLTMLAQQTSESQSRAVTIPVSAVSFNPELPPLVPSRYIRTNDAGTGFQLSSLVQPGDLEVSVLGEALINDPDTDTMQTTLGGSTVGKAVFTALTQTIAQTALGGTTVGRAVFTAVDAAAARSAIGAADAAATVNLTGAQTIAGNKTFSDTLRSSSATSPLGYASNSVTVAQTTSKSSAVTQNGTCVIVDTHDAALAAGASVQFTLNNSYAASGTIAIASLDSGSGNYMVNVVQCGTGLVRIRLTNTSAGSLSQVVSIRVVLLAGGF